MLVGVTSAAGGVDDDLIERMTCTLLARTRETGIGRYDGHERSIEEDEGTFFLYGPDGDALYAVVADILWVELASLGATITIVSNERAERRTFALSPLQ